MHLDLYADMNCSYVIKLLWSFWLWFIAIETAGQEGSITSQIDYNISLPGASIENHPLVW